MKHDKNNKPHEYFVSLKNRWCDYQSVAFGGLGDGSSFSGSRASYWILNPSCSYSNVSVRSVCKHINYFTERESYF